MVIFFTDVAVLFSYQNDEGSIFLIHSTEAILIHVLGKENNKKQNIQDIRRFTIIKIRKQNVILCRQILTIFCCCCLKLKLKSKMEWYLAKLHVYLYSSTL